MNQIKASARAIGFAERRETCEEDERDDAKAPKVDRKRELRCVSC